MDVQQDVISEPKREELLAIEGQAIASFLKVVNNFYRGKDSLNPMSERTALKFLIARKFNVERALQLYQEHEMIRLREGLTSLDPNDPDLKSELESEKFTIFKNRDANDSAIAVFTAKLHVTNKSSKEPNLRKKTHCDTLQGIVYQLDAALEDVITQRNGIVFIYNMSNSDFSNFDVDLCQKILNLLKGAYPAKLKKVLIVNSPLWFRAPFHLLRLVVKEKLRDRVWLLSSNQLLDHVPAECLTSELGGSYQHNHQAWLDECNNLYKTRYNDLCDPTSAQSIVKAANNKSSSKRSSQDASGPVIEGADAEEPIDPELIRLNSGIINNNNNLTSAYDYDDTGLPLDQFVAMIKEKGKSGLGAEYERFPHEKPTRSVMVSSTFNNSSKNRYINVKCYDHTRVVLQAYDLPLKFSSEDTRDYINANHIDGYRQPRAYISTQGPLEGTVMDFWRMIWQTGSRVIVMVTLIIENNMLKCDKYWPSSEDKLMKHGVYKIEFLNEEIHDDFIVTLLRLTNTISEVSRDIWHLQFISWPDFGTPQPATFFKFREHVLKKQLDAIELAGGNYYPPIVIHCSAGVGRSGTFMAVDICIQKLETTGLVDVHGVVERLKDQRFLSVQTKEQYIFCHKAVLDYAVSCRLLDSKDLMKL